MNCRVLVACSGPGDSVQRAMAAADRIGAVWWAVTIGIFVVALLLRASLSRHSLFATAVCAAFHPSWWMSVSHGDCGGMKEMVSPLFAGIAVGCVAVGMTQQHLAAKKM